MTQGRIGFRTVLLPAVLALVVVVPTAAQELVPPNRGGLTSSLGFPPRIRPHLTLATGVHRGGANENVFYLGAGFYKDLMNPVMSLAGFMLDGYVGLRSLDELDGGFQAQLHVPLFRLAAGVDYNFLDNDQDFMLSIIHPIKRGGVIFDGGMFTASWLPGRGNSFNFGLQVPIGVPRPGKGRPRRASLTIRNVPALPVPDPSGLDIVRPHAAGVARLVDRMNALLVPFLDRSAGNHDQALSNLGTELEELVEELAGSPRAASGAPTAQGIVLEYHTALDEAFSAAMQPGIIGTNAVGRTLAAIARKAVLDEVLLPHNRLLGQFRNTDDLTPFTSRARGAFMRGAVTRVPMDQVQQERAEWLFAQLGYALDGIQAGQREQWEDERMVWLPMQLGLLPEDHDEQHEVDRLIERATSTEFTSGNEVTYILNERFQWALHQSIHEAEEYHVLWVHDIRGLDADGAPDEVAYNHVRYGYMDALIERVTAYDETGILPEFHIFLDQWFYEINGGRLWLEYLQEPLDRTIVLPAGAEAWTASLDSAQAALRDAVAASDRLQAERRAFGDDWLKNRVKVHIHITNQSDHTFWSSQIVPLVGMPDNSLRDHRKIVLWDITESDPTRGGMLLTGMGVGEHYAGSHWEDRAVLLRGPAAVPVKAAARGHLLEQGLTEDEIPFVFRPDPVSVASLEARAVSEFGDIRAVQFYNQIGFGDKSLNVAKAMLYSLLEPGSVIKTPDSLWNDPLWASLLLGSALRGARVLIISPALDNAPAAGWPQMARAYELMSRLVLAQSLLKPNLDAAGGLFRIGLYSPGVAVGDIPGRLERFLGTLEREEWLSDLYDLHPTVIDSLSGLAAELRATGFEPTYLTYDWTDQPKMHLKAQLMASREGWDHLFSQPEWAVILVDYFRERSAQVSDDGQFVDFHRLPRQIAPIVRTMEDRFFSEMSAEDFARVEYYLLVGSHNMDFRSALMDGEVELMISGPGVIVGLEDFLLLPGLCTWIQTDEELQELLPRPSGLRRRIARWIKTAV